MKERHREILRYQDGEATIEGHVCPDGRVLLSITMPWTGRDGVRERHVHSVVIPAEVYRRSAEAVPLSLPLGSAGPGSPRAESPSPGAASLEEG